MAIVKFLNDGSSVLFEEGTEPSIIQKELREKNLALALERKKLEKQLSPDYNPGTTLESDEVSFSGKFGKGLLSGLVEIPTNIVSGVGYGLQLAGQEEAGEELIARSKAVEERFAPDIEGYGLAAELPKALVQFGLPGSFVLKAAKSANLATKAAALGAAEGLVAGEDMQTIGDAYIGIGPTLTKDLSHLEGQEKALTALMNKGKVGLEGAALTAGIPAVFGLLGATFSDVATVGSKVPGVKQAGKELDKFISSTGQGIDSLLNKYPKADKIAGLFRYRGILPDKEFAEIRDARAVEFAALSFKNQLTLDEVNDTMTRAFKTGKQNGVAEKNIMDALDSYLFPTDEILEADFSKAANTQAYGQALSRQEEAAKVLIETDKKLGWGGAKITPKTAADDITSEYSLFRAAKRARDTIDEYSKRITSKPEFLPEGVEDIIGGQIGLYATRQYKAFLDPGWQPTEEAAEKALETVIALNKKAGKKISREQAISQLRGLVDSKGFLNATLDPKQIEETINIKKVSDGVLKGRALNAPAIREWLGEYTSRPTFAGKQLDVDERKANLMVKTKETMGRQAALITKADFIDYLQTYNKTLPDDKKIFLDNPPLMAQRGEYVQIPKGVGYGSLSEKYVKKDYASALQKNNESFYQNMPVLGAAYSTFLGLKGLSQLGKTVYNVTGQIRNVTSAMGFAIANGNLPNRSTFSEGWSTVAANVMKKFPTEVDQRKRFQYYAERGIVGQQAQLGELKDLIQEASEYGGLGKKLFSNRIMEKAQNNIMTRLYQGGDDVWRIFNFESEANKLRAMVTSSQVKGQPFVLKATTNRQRQIARKAGLDPNNVNVLDIKNKKLVDEFLEEEAAFVTRDVVPNYERVPEVVRMIRRTPLGNFIAYPAEIIRTSANVLGRAIKEISSENPYLRSRGMERLLGFTAITTAIPSGTVALGTMLTGATEEQIAAYKRSFAWPWEKTATLVPLSTDKDGNVTEVMNLSYTMPYDFLLRPFAAVQTAVDNGVRTEKELTDIATDAMSMMYQDMFAPFFGESMLTERLADVFVRNGQTNFGTRVWSVNDNLDLGEKTYAGFAHIFNGLVPTMSPAQLNPKVSFRKAIQSVPGDGTLGEKVAHVGFRGFNVGDLPRSVLVESQLVNPKYRVNDKSRQVDFSGEMTEAISGTKSVKFDIKRRLGFQAIEAAGELRTAQQELNNLRKASGYRTSEEYLNAYKKANEMRFKALKELSVAVDDAEYLGMNKSEIYKILSDARVADWQDVVNNNFIPYSPPPDIFKDAYEVGETKIRNIADRTEMFEEYSKNLGRQLSPEFVRPPVSAPVTSDIGLFRDKSQVSDSQRAAQVLRQQEMRKLLGVD